MCKLGDIIVIKEYKGYDSEKISKHSFVVINDEKNTIQGLNYDFVANVMCSFHNNVHKNKKLKFKSNLIIKAGAIKGYKLNNKEEYIRADKLYYFNKNKIKYKVIAHNELLNELLNLILELHNDNKLKNILTNI